MYKNNISTPLISVIVLTYNQQDFIGKTLDSIVGQKHSYPIEIVVGDDCSCDDTPKILRQYQEKYPEIVRAIINERNLGIIGNYFNVVRHCRGKYVMECAGDDYWLPGKIMLQISFMEDNPECGLSYTRVRYSYQNNKKKSKTWGGNRETFSELLLGNTIPALSVAMKKDLLDRFCLEIDPENKNWQMEDYPVWLWFSKNSNIHFLPEVTAVYNVLEESASHSKNYIKELKFMINSGIIASYFAHRYSTLESVVDSRLLWGELELAVIQKEKEHIMDIRERTKILYKTYRSNRMRILLMGTYFPYLFLNALKSYRIFKRVVSYNPIVK